uniref:CCHC-type domain-containing protein n=2 Tax=Trichogramma kaykai TaxID=54128 RepID=A0ABD2W2L4_9HYME
MNEEHTKTTSGGIQSTPDSYRVQAPVVSGSPMDSEGGTSHYAVQDGKGGDGGGGAGGKGESQIRGGLGVLGTFFRSVTKDSVKEIDVDETKEEEQDGDTGDKGKGGDGDQPNWGGGAIVYSLDPKGGFKGFKNGGGPGPEEDARRAGVVRGYDGGDRFVSARLEERERIEERVFEEIEKERGCSVSKTREVIAAHSTPKTQQGAQRGVRMAGGGKKEDVAAVPSSPTYALVVKGGEVKEGSKVKEKLMEMGKGMNVKVKAIRQTKEGVIMELASEEKRKKVLTEEGWKDKGLHFEQPKVFPPLVSIVGVPKDMDNQELVEEVWLKNLSTRMKQDDDFGMKVKRRNSGRGTGQFDTVILEVTPNVRDVLLDLGRVYVGFGSCRVYLYERVLRCLGCYGYAHIKRDCRRAERCIRCGKEGHKGKDCKGKVECGNCRDKGMNCQHSALSEACPEHKWRLQKWRERVMV